MKAKTRTEETQLDESPSPANVASIQLTPRLTEGSRRQSALAHFISELRRRRVCRAATMYAVAMWLVSQVVDLIAVPLGLPEWTLQFVMVLGLVCFPIALLLSWLLDITPDGVIRDSGSTSDQPRTKVERLIDGFLLTLALVIGVELAFTDVGSGAATDAAERTRIAVLPFEVAAGEGAAEFSYALAGELRHELARRANVTVIAPIDPSGLKRSMSLTGVVATDHEHVRITATLVDNESSEIIWADVFSTPIGTGLITPAEMASLIAESLRLSRNIVVSVDNRG